MIRRREFIAMLGGAAAAWPLVARAQQRTPVVGFLHSASFEAFAERLRAFRQGLKETGYAEAEDVVVEYRFAENEMDRLPMLANELVRRPVTVIVAAGGGEFAAKAATATIPVVFYVAEDPVGTGLVASLNRPGGNLTGVNFLASEVAAKRLELLRELVPGAARVAVLVNPAGPAAETTMRNVHAAARRIGVQIQVRQASNSGDINAAFAAFARERPDALFVAPDPFFTVRRSQLVNLAAHHSIPTSYSVRQYPEIGGLMSYGTSLTDAWRQVGVYTGLIVNGAKPADLPIVQASKFELVINAETARMLGLTVPPTLLALADEVIE
jgi:putative tryptophan/tyrosine transport system substrate-binding protein